MMREIALPRAIVKLTQTTMGARSPAASRAAVGSDGWLGFFFGFAKRQK